MFFEEDNETIKAERLKTRKTSESCSAISSEVLFKGYRMVNPRLCETARPFFKNPRPNYKSSRLQDCSTCSETVQRAAS